MPQHIRLLALCFAAHIVMGCEDRSLLDATSAALLAGADKCLLSVRDDHTPYEQAPACSALDSLVDQYIEAGGARPSAPAEFELRFEKTRALAWMALAISKSGDATLRIW